jgi:hypothetical protein
MASEESIGRRAWRLYKAQARKTLPTSFNFAMVAVAVMALAFLLPSTLYLSVPFVLIPFLFAFQMTAFYLRKNDFVTNREFFAYFRAYFKTPFAGCYRVLRNFLLALLWSLAVGVVVGVVYYAVASSIDASFTAAVNDVSALFVNGSLSDVEDYLAASAPLALCENVVSLAELFAGFYAFTHYLSSYGVNPYLRSAIVGASPRVSNLIYAGGLKTVGPRFWKDYYSALWLGIILFVLGFASGVGVGLLFIEEDSLLWGVSGILGSLIFLFAYLPYYFSVMGLLADKYRNGFADYSIKMAQRTLQELQQSQKLSEEEAESLRKSIDSAEKSLSGDDKPSESEPSDDSKDPK